MNTEDDTFDALLRPTFQDVRDAVYTWYHNDGDIRGMRGVVEDMRWTIEKYKAECASRGLGLIHTNPI